MTERNISMMCIPEQKFKKLQLKLQHFLLGVSICEDYDNSKRIVSVICTHKKVF